MDSNGISDLYASIFSGTTGLIALVFYVLVVIGLWKVCLLYTSPSPRD